MKTKLLQRYLKSYVLFAIFVLLIGAPAFYFITQKLYIDDTNETLLISKNTFLRYTLPNLQEKNINSFNRMSWNIKVLPSEKNLNIDVFQYRSFHDSLENEDETYRVLLSPIKIENKPYLLMVRMNMIESGDLVESIALIFIGITIFLLIGLYFITQKLSRWLWAPFYKSLYQIEKFELDKDFLPTWPETNIDEFSRLNNALETLIERNIIIYKNQKEFIENAAHELQTPLAAFMAKLDSLMQAGDISSTQAKLIGDLYEAAVRLNRLNKNLLLLSKLDQGWYSEETLINVGELVQKQISFFEEQANARNISISIELNNNFSFKANPFLFETTVNNLLMNSIKHNRNNGSIHILFQHNKLIIYNSGKQEALDNCKIFDRFSKTDPSYSGNGLGLSIVKKIADLYKWNISYKWENNFHVFELDFSGNSLSSLVQ